MKEKSAVRVWLSAAGFLPISPEPCRLDHHQQPLACSFKSTVYVNVNKHNERC